MWGVRGRYGGHGGHRGGRGTGGNRGFQQVRTHSNCWLLQAAPLAGKHCPMLTKLAPERTEVIQELHKGGAFGGAVGGAGEVEGAVWQVYCNCFCFVQHSRACARTWNHLMPPLSRWG